MIKLPKIENLMFCEMWSILIFDTYWVLEQCWKQNNTTYTEHHGGLLLLSDCLSNNSLPIKRSFQQSIW